MYQAATCFQRPLLLCPLNGCLKQVCPYNEYMAQHPDKIPWGSVPSWSSLQQLPPVSFLVPPVYHWPQSICLQTPLPWPQLHSVSAASFLSALWKLLQPVQEENIDFSFHLAKFYCDLKDLPRIAEFSSANGLTMQSEKYKKTITNEIYFFIAFITATSNTYNSITTLDIYKQQTKSVCHATRGTRSESQRPRLHLKSLTQRYIQWRNVTTQLSWINVTELFE